MRSNTPHPSPLTPHESSPLHGMTNGTFKDIEKLESDLWEAADNLRANSKLTSSDYFMPVLGVIFLRHAANRFDAATWQIEDLIGAGAIFASVTKKELKAQELLTPSSRLIQAFEEVSRSIDEQLRVLFLQNQKLRTARDLLLPRLMSGEIAV